MKKLRIAVLLHKGLLPPSSLKGFSKEEREEWKVEYDVISTLKKLKHNVEAVEMFGELNPLRQILQDYKPHIAFNLIEEFHEYPLFDQQVTSYLEMKKIPYTGCNPRGMMISKNKALSKKILLYHNIKTPKFNVFPLNRKIKESSDLKFPIFIKSLSDDGSSGVSEKSLVKNINQLKEQVNFIHRSTKTHAIAEEFIEGREIYVGVIGTGQIKTFTPWELIFNKDRTSTPIATDKIKWDLNHQKKLGVTTKAARLSQNLKNEFSNVSKLIYNALLLSGYARLDFRLSEENEIYFIESNANPHISSDEDFAMSAKHSGFNYSQLIEEIIKTGLKNNFILV
jgi:D-alanine-D-alanine ligase